VTGPRALYASGSAGVVHDDAATVRAPRAEAASGLTAPESVACSMSSGAPFV
jgi:hypothetical protein